MGKPEKNLLVHMSKGAEQLLISTLHIELIESLSI